MKNSFKNPKKLKNKTSARNVENVQKSTKTCKNSFY